jgi:hypothetical protein
MVPWILSHFRAFNSIINTTEENKNHKIQVLEILTSTFGFRCWREKEVKRVCYEEENLNDSNQSPNKKLQLNRTDYI